ncbi:hypothetical protein KFE98_19940 [bacterium SCSIO 12741]|nr:hypothetical protein KFE98_19940 [bacterium SCSIO 12741]
MKISLTILLILLSIAGVAQTDTSAWKVHPDLQEVEEEKLPCYDHVHPESQLTDEAFRKGWKLVDYSLSKCDHNSNAYESVSRVKSTKTIGDTTWIETQVIKNCCGGSSAEIQWVDSETINLVVREVEGCTGCFCYCVFCGTWIIDHGEVSPPKNIQLTVELIDYSSGKRTK